MMGKSDTTIATLLRHSTTRLVKRYTKMNVEYLQGVVEELSAFGKPQGNGDSGVPKLDEKLSNPNGTVTETVTGEREEKGSRA